MTSVCVTLTLSSIETVPDDYRSIRCPACTGELNFHQPDPRQAHRLLAVCDECDAWLLIDMARAEILQLPCGEIPRDEA